MLYEIHLGTNNLLLSSSELGNKTQLLGLMPCRLCTNLPEFYCNNCHEPLCYPCLLKAYIIEHDRTVDVPKICAICTKEFNKKKLWELRIQKLEYWDTENPTRSNTI